MKIEIHNDGKGKYQSWEAKAILNHEVTNAWSIMEVEAYGATEQEARQNLGKLIKSLVQDLTQIQSKNEKKTFPPTI